jgi:inorganic triphosphatase YgiF
MRKPRHEIEVKFEVAPRNVTHLQRVLRQRAKRPAVRETLTSVYFDTPRHLLRRSGITLRVRQTGRRYTQTVKYIAPATGLLDRAEWEWAVPGPGPDLKLARKTGLRAFADQLAPKIAPVFRSTTRRMRFMIAGRRSLIEAALDDGTTIAGRRRQQFRELELELKRGTVEALIAFAKRLGESVELRLSVTTKAARGYGLLDGASEARATTTDSSALQSDTPAADAFQLIMQRCFARLVQNQSAAIGGDTDAVHEIRIAIRQLRVAIDVFAHVVGNEESVRIKGELRWINNELGRARDIDVFFRDVLQPWSKGRMRRAGVADTYQAFDRRRGEIHAQAAAALRSSRFTSLLLDIMGFVSGERDAPGAGEPIGRTRAAHIDRYAALELQRRRAKFVRVGRKLRRLSEHDRHQLRIRGKKLRYAIEFFEDVYPGKKHQKRHYIAVRALKQFQDALGALHDLAQQRALARSYVQRGKATDRSMTPGSTTRARRAHARKLLDASVRAYQQFAEVKPFWA